MASDRIEVEVEICLSSSSTARPSDIRDRALLVLERAHRSSGVYAPGPVTALLTADTEYLAKHVRHARICEIVSPSALTGSSAGVARAGAPSSSVPAAVSVYLPCVPLWQAVVRVLVYQLSEDGPSNEAGGGGDGGADGGGETDVVSQYTQWNLPALEFEGTWEALVYDDDGDAEEPAAAAAGGAGSSSSSSSSTGGADGGKRARSSEGAGAAADPEGDAGGSLVGSRLKPALLQYAASALLFSDAGVDTSLISWNHVILLHGPPGTGKTSLCKALAHKLAIRLSDRYPSAQLIEINAHSLFSRWFSESGKLVHRLFAHIGELVADEDSLVFLLIDEVESLTAARKAAVSGSEPSDAVRVVNAVLTAIDSFRTRKNVLLLTTSNVSEAIDVAFVDRADIKALVGPPGTTARYDILASCVNELVRVGLVRLEASKGSAATAKAVAPGARLATAAEVRALARAAAGGPLPLLVAGGPADSMAVDGAGAGAGAAAASASSSTTGSLALLPAVDEAASLALWKTAVAAVNFSGRTLRKLPLQAHAMYVRARVVSGADFGVAMLRGVQAEKTARVGFADV